MSTKSIYCKSLFSLLTLVLALVSFSSLLLSNVSAQAARGSQNQGAGAGVGGADLCGDDQTISASPADYAAGTIADCNYKKLKYGDEISRAGGSVDDLETSSLTGPPETWINTLLRGISGDTSVFASDVNVKLTQGDTGLLFALMKKDTGGLNGGVRALNKDLLNQKPISGTEFFEEKVYALTHPGEVKAQDVYYRGTGFDLLKPVQSFWGWSVNIVYGLLIFIIIGVAFAIMFRNQIGDGIAISIQTAIPNIALAMLLVPLSYAISGLIVDGMTLGLNVTQQFLLGPGAPGREVYDARETEFTCDLFTDAPGLDSTDNCDPAAGLGADDVRVSWLYASANLNYSDEIFGFTEDLPIILGFHDVLQSLIGWLAGGISAIVNLILGIILLLTGLRIFWALFNKFILFIMGPIFAPFFFAAIAVPGQGINAAMQYVKLLSSAALYYIVAYAMTLLSLIFSSAVFQNKIAGLGFSAITPPMLAFENILAGSGGTQVPATFINFYTALISLGIYLMIPKTLKNIDAMLGTEQALPSFVTDAWDSAKESINLGRQGLNIARNAPGQISGAVSTAKGLPGRAQRRLIQAQQSALNLTDRVRGIRPGEQGSFAFRRSQKLRDDIDDLENKRAAAMAEGNTARALYYENMSTLKKNALEGIKSSEFGGANSNIEKIADEGAKLTAEVSWGGQNTGGYITIPDKTMDIMRDRYRRMRAGERGIERSFKLPPAGKITLKPEGFKLTPNVLARLAVIGTSLTDATPTNRPGVNDPSADALVNAVPTAGNDVQGPSRRGLSNVPGSRTGWQINYGNEGSFVNTMNDTLQFAGGAVEIDWQLPHVSPDGGGSWSIGFAFVIPDIRVFLDPGGFGFGPDKAARTGKFKFQVQGIGNERGNVTSNEVVIQLQSNG